MKDITLHISEAELEEVTRAYKVIQSFIERLVSPNDLYTQEFVEGLDAARADVERGEFTEVKDLADFIQ